MPVSGRSHKSAARSMMFGETNLLAVPIYTHHLPKVANFVDILTHSHVVISVVGVFRVAYIGDSTFGFLHHMGGCQHYGPFLDPY